MTPPIIACFPFNLGVTALEDEAASSAESAALSKDAKTKFQEFLFFLNQDISLLVQDAANPHYPEVSKRSASRVNQRSIDPRGLHRKSSSASSQSAEMTRRSASARTNYQEDG